MRKVLIGIIAGLLMCGQALAGIDSVQIINTTLDDDPTSITGTRNIADYGKVGFYVVYDETQVGNSISVAVTLHVSHDGTNWITGYFYDFAGGTTLQTSETLSSDGSYVFWLPAALQVPYARVTITATNSDADDLADVDCFVTGQR